MLTLLFFYPLCLLSVVVRIPADVVVWRIYLFPIVAAVILLTLIPAIRRGQGETRANGTPWLWPWYPWSLFVFLGVCICFRAYALSQSFDPILGESLVLAMKFPSVFGVYFLIPLVFAVGLLLLEIGIVERRSSVMQFAMFAPAFALAMRTHRRELGGPYAAFLRCCVPSMEY